MKEAEIFPKKGTPGFVISIYAPAGKAAGSSQESRQILFISTHAPKKDAVIYTIFGAQTLKIPTCASVKITTDSFISGKH